MSQKTSNAALPVLVAHSDWGTNPNKQWTAKAVLDQNGCYHAFAPRPTRELGNLLEHLSNQAPSGSILAGFDFPIGLPAAYARRAGIRDFLSFLLLLGKGEWAEFYQPAERPVEICIYRPFYPQRPGGTRLQHLIDGLGLQDATEIRRQCEKAHSNRRAAAPLFWTMGGQQVGKAALCGWKQVLQPALQTGSSPGWKDRPILIWPFSGTLSELLVEPAIILAETYPAEFYNHLGIKFSSRNKGRRTGKRVQAERARNASTLLNWAADWQVNLEPELQAMIRDGFDPDPQGEDQFDAFIGLAGMIKLLRNDQAFVVPEMDEIHRVEGWILGQSVI